MFGSKNRTTAQIVDNVLVIAASDGKPAMLWRVDLSAAKAARLSLKPEEGTGFALVFAGLNGEAEQIVARYADRAAAEAAFRTVSRALLANPVLAAAGGGGLASAFAMAFGAILIAFIAFFGVRLLVHSVTPPQSESRTAPDEATPADDILEPPAAPAPVTPVPGAPPPAAPAP